MLSGVAACHLADVFVCARNDNHIKTSYKSYTVCHWETCVLCDDLFQ